MPSTVRDLNELTAPAANDYFLVADTSDVVDKDKKMQLGKVPFKNGTPIAGRLARWTDANQVEDAGIASSAVALKFATPTGGNMASWADANQVGDSGVAVANVSKLDTAQSYTALKTFSAGLKFANETMSAYGYGTWTPIMFGSVGGSGTYGYQIGDYTRIGNRMFIDFSVNLSSKGSLSGNVIVSNIPMAVATVTGHMEVVLCSNMAPAGTQVFIQTISASAIGFYKLVSNSLTALLWSDITATCLFGGKFSYQV